MKILGKAGVSLADVYEIEGSVAGVEELESGEVHTVHEMGSTIFAERLTAVTTVIATSGLAQNIDIGVGLTQPITPRRILALAVIIDTTARVSRLQISVASGPAGSQNEVPLFSWELGTGTDVERGVLIEIDGTVATHFQLVPGPSSIVSVPTLLVGSDGPITDISRIIMRGRTSGFGAGTVVVRGLIYEAFSELEGISSFGLPIPGW